MSCGFCDVGYNMATNTNNIIQSSHNDTDRVIAKLDSMENARQQEKVAALQLENQGIKFQLLRAHRMPLLLLTRKHKLMN